MLVNGCVVALFVLIAMALTGLPDERTMRTLDRDELAALRVDIAVRGLSIVAFVAAAVLLVLVGGPAS